MNSPINFIKKSQAGFTLVELLVTISIFIIVTSITIANFPAFSNKLSLDLLAEDMALSFKQAQVLGSSVSGTITGSQPSGQKNFQSAFGVHLEAYPGATSGLPFPNYYYLLFTDLLSANSTYGNLTYDGPLANTGAGSQFTCGDPATHSPVSTNECLDEYVMGGINKVLYICQNYYDPANSSTDYSKDSRVNSCSSRPLNRVDVTFIRPNLAAHFAIQKNSGDNIIVDDPNVLNIGVVLGVPGSVTGTPGGFYRKAVIIWRSGLITTE